MPAIPNAELLTGIGGPPIQTVVAAMGLDNDTQRRVDHGAFDRCAILVQGS